VRAFYAEQAAGELSASLVASPSRFTGPLPLGPQIMDFGHLVRWLDRAPRECVVESRWATIRNCVGVSARTALRALA
jgi:hypothetical protein